MWRLCLQKHPKNTSKTESTHNFSSQTLQSFIMNDQSVYIERLTFSRFTNTSASTTTWIATHYVVWAKFRILRTIFLKLSNIRFSERMHLAILTIKCIFMLKARHFHQEATKTFTPTTKDTYAKTNSDATLTHTAPLPPWSYSFTQTYYMPNNTIMYGWFFRYYCLF